MYKVFIAEDEDTIREEIREALELDGRYAVCGEAADGELALPMIQELRPDILITDICMPFLDGLKLSSIIKANMPWVHILILSGFDEFRYAQEAIEIGVGGYVLKPLNEKDLFGALDKIAARIEEERTKLLETLSHRQREEQEKTKIIEHYFNEIIVGAISAPEVYSRAKELGIDILAPCYVLCQIPLREDEDTGKMRAFFKKVTSDMDGVIGFNYGDSFLLIIKGESEEKGMELSCETAQFIEQGVRRMFGKDIVVNIGNVVKRVSELPALYREIRKGGAQLDQGEQNSMVRIIAQKEQPQVTMELSSSASLTEKLRYIDGEDIPQLVDSHFSVTKNEKNASILYRYYLLVDLIVTSVRMLKELGFEGDAGMLSDEVGGSHVKLLEYAQSYQEICRFAQSFLEKVIAKRDSVSGPPRHEEIKKAKEYIMEHYGDEGLSLHTVAMWVGFSPNHFSTLFSQQMGVTFIEYLIRYRIEQSKRMLEETPMKLTDITFKIGYSEPRYFSYVFKKYTGMSPRAYRKAYREKHAKEGVC